jgi:hypothetical protein
LRRLEEMMISQNNQQGFPGKIGVGCSLIPIASTDFETPISIHHGHELPKVLG